MATAGRRGQRIVQKKHTSQIVADLACVEDCKSAWVEKVQSLTSKVRIAFGFAVGSDTENNKAEQGREDEFSEESLQEIISFADRDVDELSNDDASQECAEDAANDLEDPVHKHLTEVDLTTQEDG